MGKNTCFSTTKLCLETALILTKRVSLFQSVLPQEMSQEWAILQWGKYLAHRFINCAENGRKVVVKRVRVAMNHSCSVSLRWTAFSLSMSIHAKLVMEIVRTWNKMKKFCMKKKYVKFAFGCTASKNIWSRCTQHGTAKKSHLDCNEKWYW